MNLCPVFLLFLILKNCSKIPSCYFIEKYSQIVKLDAPLHVINRIGLLFFNWKPYNIKTYLDYGTTKNSTTKPSSFFVFFIRQYHLTGLPGILRDYKEIK